jgi:signal peptidase I
VQSKKDHKGFLRRYAQHLGIALILALLIRAFVAQAYKIPGDSMFPTLMGGDLVLVNKLSYGIRSPLSGNYIVKWKRLQHGDIVVFVYPEDRSKDFIKRVIAVAGDLVEINGKRVLIDGQLTHDPHAYFGDNDSRRKAVKTGGHYGPTRVPEGRLFVLGDNRDRSSDSRSWGFVNLNDVKGTAYVIYWSWDQHAQRVRWERVGKGIE